MEGRGGEGRGGMTVIHIVLMAPYIQTNNEELYLYNNDVTYYVITCNSAFEYNNDVTYYVITRNYQWTPEILTNNLLEAGCTNKLCPFQYYSRYYLRRNVPKGAFFGRKQWRHTAVSVRPHRGATEFSPL